MIIKNNLFFIFLGSHYIVKLNTFGTKLGLADINQIVYVFNKYNFFSRKKKNYTIHIGLNTYVIVAFFKEYFFVFVDYMRPGPFAESLFDKLVKIEIYADLNNCFKSL
jgi:hypothetical protein